MQANAFDPPEGSLRRSVGRGAIITALAQSVRVATQIVSVIVLSRLLSPQDFGVVAMCAPVLAFIALFQDFGLTQATVQKSGIKHEEVNYLFWVNVAVSALLVCVLAGAAPLVAAFYGEPRVSGLVAALGLQIIAYGLGAQHLALLTRRMQFARLAIIDVASAIAGLAVSIAWTFIDRSYWALFAGTLTAAVLPTLCYWANSRWRPSLPRKVNGISELINFGAGITGFNFANFFARNLDNVLIGKYWGEAQLGLYDRAYKLLLFPLSQITNPLSKVMVPALSRLKDEPDRYRSAYLRVMPLILLVALPGVAFAIAMADVLIPFVLGEQWRQSSSIFLALGFAGLLQPLNNPAGWLFISQGRSGDFMRWGIITALTSVLAFLVGLPYGALGVAIAYAVSEYLRTPFLWLYIGKTGPLRASHILRAATPFVLGAHLALAAIWFAKPVLPQQHIVGMASAVALSYMITIMTALAFASGRETLRQALRLLPARAPKTAPSEAK
ncbi:lipopolysaccharide biosynthesis protein [Mesorhizobium sp.]|uniref:lipopolysaccharide biosynthesis protein n=1 Tax=Mesorhizobium sp. TaxID=1871066 RepID=UPI000FEA574E|nr:lipopolysaccharide biosynthesis protein [Mesorhizobium sp.]RWI29061.1 MAG: lipopolysaccharide biosynthesis protein [Mesorhizobium sp.]RWK52819.1 MAG: lipopolysaccharide biosynthesis protein [Mesorhizobium sp.]RWK97727.1 MAG: lipopolysaccharide biosynthesis protein [Mesorhizobium sp.]TIP61532.1 MAG: lipopolysaccharide biosynthesis protein [Mesorhizobium sp.]TIP99887.1 MAG: lipopolysaccharide biosynthesis protein [Mesorhizobium sp.]